MCYFLSAIVSPQRQELVESAKRVLGPRTGEFDAIVVRGMSGAVGGSLIAYALDKPLVVVRKTTEPSHGSLVEFNNTKLFPPRLLIVDDFVCTGKTVDEIVKAVFGFQTRVVGIYTYNRLSVMPTKSPNVSIPMWRTPEALLQTANVTVSVPSSGV